MEDFEDEEKPLIVSDRKPIYTERGSAIDTRFKYYSSLNLNATREIHTLLLPQFLTYNEDEDVSGENVGYIPQSQGKATFLSAIFNLTTTIVGGGTLSIPYAFKMAGMATGVFLVLFVAVICMISANLLIKAGDRCDGPSYKGIAVFALGNIGARIVEATIIIFCFGALSAYTVIMGDLIPKIVELISGFHVNVHAFYMQTWFTSLIWMSISVVPLCLLKKMSALKFTSIFSLCSTTYIVVLIIIKGIQQEIHYGPVSVPAFDWSLKMFVALPILAVAFTFHFNISPVHAELENPTNKRVQLVCTLATTCATAIYLCSGIFGIIRFGQSTDSNILNNLTANKRDYASQVGNVAFLFVVTFAFPLICYPTRINIKTLFFKGHLNNIMHVVVTILLVASAYGIAMTGINLGFVFGLVGSTAGSLVAYILPGLFYLRIVKEEKWYTWRKLVSVLLIFLGLTFSVLCTYATIVFSH